MRGDDTAQVVILGAGLDTRALRLPWHSGVVVFTVDQPEVVAFTRHVLADATPRSSVRAVSVAADLTGEWHEDLLASGFRVDVPTVWVIEGVLMYLRDEDADQLLEVVRGLSASPSQLLADLAHPNVHVNGLFAAGRRSLDSNDSPLRSSTLDPVAWLAGHGFLARTIDPIGLAAEYGRPVPPALDPRPSDGPSFWFVESWTLSGDTSAGRLGR